ncbi:MAG: ABC transporter permease [Acidobacteria bacterium]|nr:ABC transporter permease [Acidobacteriota bacterium]
MNVILDIMGRNLRLYFRDRLGVFFSLLAAIILFLLYTLFLGNLQTQGLKQGFPDAPDGAVKTFVDSWMFAGIVGITAVTTGLGAFSAFVEDGSSGRFRDFLVSPIKRSQLILGYLLSSFVIALTMTLIVLLVSVAYLFFTDGLVLTAGQLALTVAYVALSCAAYAALSAFVISFVRTQGAFSALSTIVGTVLGFLSGAYIPVGSLPEGVANVINALPFGQSSMIVRQQFTESSLTDLSGDQPQALASLRRAYGITTSIGDWDVTVGYVLAILAAMIVIFTTLAALRIRSRIR